MQRNALRKRLSQEKHVTEIGNPLYLLQYSEKKRRKSTDLLKYGEPFE